MKRSHWLNFLLIVGLLLLLMLIGGPFWLVLTSSFKQAQEIIALKPTFLPHSFTFDHYRKLIAASPYLRYLGNSLLVASFSTVIVMVLATPAAYAFFRLKFAGAELFYRLILLAYAFPSIVVLIPLFGMMAKLGLIDSLIALILVNIAFALPFSIWMLRSFFASIPKEIEEAAIMDGAGSVKILLKIMLPLIGPGVASVSIFAFITSWTEYVFASVLIISDAKRTLPVGFSGMIVKPRSLVFETPKLDSWWIILYRRKMETNDNQLPNLIPERYSDHDLFICDVADAVLKNIMPDMEHPFYSLSKKPEMTIREYEHNGNKIEIIPSFRGLATIYDKDILIYCISQIMAKIKRGVKLSDVSPRVRINSYDLGAVLDKCYNFSLTICFKIFNWCFAPTVLKCHSHSFKYSSK